jgi:hypothetical protein
LANSMTIVNDSTKGPPRKGRLFLGRAHAAARPYPAAAVRKIVDSREIIWYL